MSIQLESSPLGQKVVVVSHKTTAPVGTALTAILQRAGFEVDHVGNLDSAEGLVAAEVIEAIIFTSKFGGFRSELESALKWKAAGSVNQMVLFSGDSRFRCDGFTELGGRILPQGEPSVSAAIPNLVAGLIKGATDVHLLDCAESDACKNELEIGQFNVVSHAIDLRGDDVRLDIAGRVRKPLAVVLLTPSDLDGISASDVIDFARRVVQSGSCTSIGMWGNDNVWRDENNPFDSLAAQHHELERTGLYDSHGDDRKDGWVHNFALGAVAHRLHGLARAK